jgi:endogenous inhibitor of DNA gyrase (YacG/DUF329 family)
MKLCPTCGKPAEWQDNSHRPFCSERCKLIDLGKWVSEEYRVPGKPVHNEASEGGEEHEAPADDKQKF